MTLFCTGLVDVPLNAESTVTEFPPPLTVQEIVFPLIEIPVPAVNVFCLPCKAEYMTLFCTGFVDVELIVESTVMLPPLPPLTVQLIVFPEMLIPVPAMSLSCFPCKAVYTTLFCTGFVDDPLSVESIVYLVSVAEMVSVPAEESSSRF